MFKVDLVTGKRYRGHREHQRSHRSVLGRKVVGLDPNPGLGELGAPVLFDVRAAAVQVDGAAIYV